MPVCKIQPDGLVGLARVKAGPDLYEKESEDLLWSNLEAFVGEGTTSTRSTLPSSMPRPRSPGKS